MSLGALGGLLESSPEFQRLLRALDSSHASARVQVLADATPFALATLWQKARTPMLVVAPKPEDARRLYEQLALWSDEQDSILQFPETETLPFERLVADMDTTQQRIRTLSRMLDSNAPPPLVVASTTAVAQKTIARDTFESNSYALQANQRLDLEEALDLWRRMGYRIEPAVDAPGLVSRRGGILDIFPVGSSMPARIELWGDEIDSIRLFDPETQRSTSPVDSITVIPAQEMLPGLSDPEKVDRLMANIDLSNCSVSNRERISGELDSILAGREVEELSFYAGLFNDGCLLDYFPQDGLLALYRPSDISEATWSNDERSHDLRQVKEGRGELPMGFPSSHLLWSEVEEHAKPYRRRIEVTPWGAEELTHQNVFALPFSSAPAYHGKLDDFVEEAETLADEGHRVVAVTSVPKRLGEILGEYEVSAELPESLDALPSPGSITVLQSQGAGLSEGYALSVDGRKLVVLGDNEIFGVAKHRRTARRRSASRDAFLSELSPGDYVVHVEHGIGRFVGTGRSPRDEGDREYLIVRYADGDELYVPVDHLDRVSSYIAPLDRAPRLTRLGTQEWRRTKERVERSTREMAAELLSLYAARELAEGHSVAPDTPWQAQLEDSFPYEETPDQQATIVDVKADMEDGTPMDRLVCGDVGYGKTEIALRAAFKTVMDGKQVAILVPTTVLAQQHYVTFSQRLKAYPVTVEVLSRFRTAGQQREVVDSLASGKVDICIGTHRLIQKDVRFKELGLVIIDEEQRFGVAHKERLKQMRHEVDALTLTATPIPRTLHLSLAGIRDMSTIDTPPEERLPIKTYVSEFSDELVREAILREIDRQGQVYFLHNRVHNIDYMADYVRKLVPEARVGVGHGQMSEEQLETSMVDFADGKFDVLVCTTIIESGLDITNVNTIIVNRADTFGLAQLYQLRGRIGRGARRAYAYLLIPPSKSLTETAEKRLKTMLEATELGAGFRIAMKDLEIRGAGNVLGAEQSGHILAVGFDLYTRLLSEAVEGLRAQRASGLQGDGAAATEGDVVGDLDSDPGLATDIRPSVELGIPASIPEQYIADLPMRLGIYRRIAGIQENRQIDSMAEELLDRFGPLPWQVQNLLYVVRLKLQARDAGVESITREDGYIVLRLHDDVGGAGPALQRLLGSRLRVGHTQIRLDLSTLSDGWEAPLMDATEKLAEFRERLGVGVGG